MIENPLFIIGTERSGSNLLRLILNAHSQLVIPHPPHVMHYFHPLEASYGSLEDDQAFLHLAQDVLGLLKVHIYPWDLPILPQDLVQEAPWRSLFGLYVALYERYRQHSGKPRWGCKSTFMINHIPLILEHFPRAQLLWLVRDPRDVAASSRRSVFSTFHPYHTACLWRDQQAIALSRQATLSQSTLHLIRYEDLTASPRQTLEALCAFLRLPFEPALLRHFETAEARRSGSLSESWAQTSQPIHAGQVRRYRTDLSDLEVRCVEAVTGDIMRRLGYVPELSAENVGAFSVGPLLKARFALEERWLALQVEARSLRQDRNVGRRWARGLYLRSLRLRCRGRSLFSLRPAAMGGQG